MALRRKTVPICPFKSLVDGVTNFWTASGSGTSEYYYNRAVFDITRYGLLYNCFDHEPNKVLIGGAATAKSVNAPGNLAVGEWAWGDNDALGYNTIYVRLADGTDPDTKASGHIRCSEPILIMLGQNGNETIVLSFLISNHSEASDANIWIFHTWAENCNSFLQFKWPLKITASSPLFALDPAMIVLEPSDRLWIMSDIEDVSVIVSVDETYGSYAE